MYFAQGMQDPVSVSAAWLLHVVGNIHSHFLIAGSVFFYLNTFHPLFPCTWFFKTSISVRKKRTAPGSWRFQIKPNLTSRAKKFSGFNKVPKSEMCFYVSVQSLILQVCEGFLSNWMLSSPCRLAYLMVSRKGNFLLKSTLHLSRIRETRLW